VQTGPVTRVAGLHAGSANMNSSAEQNSLRRYRDLLIATSDDMLRNQLCRLIAEQERQALLQQISEQPSPANHAEPV